MNALTCEITFRTKEKEYDINNSQSDINAIIL